MAWGSVASSDSLTLTGSLVTVKKDSSDWSVSLNPRELAHIQCQFNPQTTPTEDCKVVVQTSPDGGTTWDTEPFFELVIDNGTDPNNVSFTLLGVKTFRFQATVLDTDGTAGGDDTSSALVIDVILDGVDA